MTVYVFDEVAVFDSYAGGLQLARNARITVTDPDTGAVAPDLTQDGQPVTAVTTTVGGAAVWSSTMGRLRITSPRGLSRIVYSSAMLDEAVAAPAAAQAAQAAAASSASDAAASAALVGAPAGSAIDARISSGLSPAIRKGDLRVNVRDYGALGDGTTDDTTAVTNAVADAIAKKRALWFPDGTYLVDAPILVQSTSDFRLEMEGRLKRKAASTANSLLYFLNVTGLRVKTIRTHGNVMNNQKAQSDSNTYPVDEAKHDVRVENCTDVEIDLLDSKDPAGDSCYVTGTTTRVKIKALSSVSAQSSGRNALSIVSGSIVQVDALMSDGTGCATGVIAMPGGFDIEPNSGQSVSDVEVGKLWVRTSGTSGVSVYGHYTGSGTLGAGVRQIKRVKIGQATLIKTAGVKTASCDIPIAGVDDLTIGRLTHSTDASNTNQALAIDDASNVQIDVDIPRTGNTPVNIGATATVDHMRLTGRIGASGSHCLQVYALTNSLVDMKLKNPAAGSMLVSKNATGASSNVRFRGDWRKDTTGSWAMNIAGTVTDWLLDGVDMTGWVADTRVKGTGTPGNVDRRNVKGLTYGTAAPNFDTWAVGHTVENTAPSELGSAGSKYVIRGWICTVAGTPGTWLPMRTLTGN